MILPCSTVFSERRHTQRENKSETCSRFKRKSCRTWCSPRVEWIRIRIRKIGCWMVLGMRGSPWAAAVICLLVSKLSHILCDSVRGGGPRRFKGSASPTRIQVPPWIDPPFGKPLPKSLHMHFNFPVVGNCLARPLGPSCRICLRRESYDFLPTDSASRDCIWQLPGERGHNVQARHMLAL